jgi:hypothetical protein
MGEARRDYYVKTDRTPVYRAALALHPSYGYDYSERHWKVAMDKPQWYRDMQSAVGNLFDEHARQAEVETQAQAGLLESEGGETDAEVDDYGSFGKRSIRSLSTQRKKAKTIRLVGIVWTVPYCLRMWKRYPEIMSFDNTYNTNRFKLPLFQIMGQTCLKSVYNAAFGLVDNERREGFQFLTAAVRDLTERHAIPLPDVVITDYDQAMKEALDSQYPEMPATAMYPPYPRKRSS